jgi:hypothetical protein
VSATLAARCIRPEAVQSTRTVQRPRAVSELRTKDLDMIGLPGRSVSNDQPLGSRHCGAMGPALRLRSGDPGRFSSSPRSRWAIITWPDGCSGCSRPPSQTWRTFLTNHRSDAVAPACLTDSRFARRHVAAVVTPRCVEPFGWLRAPSRSMARRQAARCAAATARLRSSPPHSDSRERCAAAARTARFDR